MVITVTTQKTHWNYFLAIERDMENVARYVEFAEPNFSTYSIELTHLLFAAASEVDVLAKLLCEMTAPSLSRRNIDDYRFALSQTLPSLSSQRVYVPRFGLSFIPWMKWSNETNPDWWRSYNNVKHERNAHHNEATLQNALNALGALLLLNHEYYSRTLSENTAVPLRAKETSRRLEPTSGLLRLSEDCYPRYLTFT
jgi:hypothetical protein